MAKVHDARDETAIVVATGSRSTLRLVISRDVLALYALNERILTSHGIIYRFRFF